ncbi:MAG: acetate kinase, partial [Cyanobacteria bacterium]|nr:acetate kinase [Cyanobacteriota bacterium]MDW8201000.1 acetate kinase [Cyanobacteriota bacterium SKYGB_h_bin112]
MKILVLNAGSSSQKSCLYELGTDLPDHPPAPLWEGTIDWTASPDYGLVKIRAQGHKQEQHLPMSQRQQAIAHLLQTLLHGDTAVLTSLEEINVVGHRVVHGGQSYNQPTLITPEVTATIAQLIPLAPNHNPAHLEGIHAIAQLLPTTPQIAVFDTAFHTSIPAAVALYPIPYEWSEQGIRRYGFHGISHQYCAQRAAQLLNRPLESLRLVSCHLGNGCSLTAVQGGRSINTSMGFTPLEGLMMGTRCGSIDPAIPLYLMRQHGLSVDEVDTLLNKASGLKGVTGESGDLRLVLAGVSQGNPRAILAFDMYIQRLVMGIGAMVASLGGIDALV